MAGLTSTLHISKSALAAQQYGLNVTGNNISNVNNTDYSIQRAEHTNRSTLRYGGFLFGTGVTMSDVQQSVDRLLENRLTDEKSTLSAFEEAESYMRILEGIFDENSDSSLTSIFSNYWSSWHDLSLNPLGSAERVLVYETGNQMAERFNKIGTDLDGLLTDLTREIQAGLTDINSLSRQIADLNVEILSAEVNGVANDLRDKRNGLIDELGEMINLDVVYQSDGSALVSAANGATLVNRANNYQLVLDDGAVMWKGTTTYDITSDISGGKLAGWLDMRDVVIPKYRAEVNELAHEMIWAVNYQQSQGAGLGYYSDTLTGYYAVDDSGWLSSLAFGDKIDYSKDTSIWIEDTTSAVAEYRNIMMDMGISTAGTSKWTGVTPGARQGSYKLTVVDEGDIGDKIVTESSGDNLGEVWSTTSGGATTALDKILANQTLKIYNTPTGDHEIDIADSGGDAKRSAASIAESLSRIDGVDAYASTNQVAFDLTNIAEAQDGDTVKYSIYVDGIVHQQSFVVDSNTGSLDQQFEDSLVAAAKAVNQLNGDTDLYADGLELTSNKGATLGVQDFEVQDNAGILLDNFNNFDNTDTVEFTITTDGVPTTSTNISIDLSGITDTTDQDAMAEAFSKALSSSLDPDTFTVEFDDTNNAVKIRTLDGSNITLRDATGDTGDDATIDMTALNAGTSSAAGNSSFEFLAAGNDVETFNSDTESSDRLQFSVTNLVTTGMTGTTSFINETTFTGAGATTAAAIMGTVTVTMDDGISILSDSQTGQGFFGTSGAATTGSSIITLGGEDGFSNFTAGETVSFDVDGVNVNYVVSTAAGGTTSSALANQLYTALMGAPLLASDYSVIQNGKSVSIIKTANSKDPIKITNFNENATNDATLAVSTGSGRDTHKPENVLLESGNIYRDFVTSTLYDNKAKIHWEKLDAEGLFTGESGLVTVEDEGTVNITENGATTLSFDLDAGSLVAGNTLTVNTDTNGEPDPLNFTINNQANSVNDTYTFTVKNGGTVGHLDADGNSTLIVEWRNSVSSGSFIIEGDDPPHTPATPVSVKVDGMTLNFHDGSLFEGDVFTITTNESGTPTSTNSDGEATGQTMSDWHWTLDSFSDQFNRQTGAVTATVNHKNQLELSSSQDYHVMENVKFSGTNGFSSDNTSITITNYGALDFNASNMQFTRSATGAWGILNDGTGGEVKLIPEGGSDNEFEVDFNGDGIGDMTVKFGKAISGEGHISFDMIQRNSNDINFGFGDDSTEDSGFLAAAGLNTMFTGDGALDMKINSVMADTKYIGAGQIDSDTGEVSQGDSRNAVAFTELQEQNLTIKQWRFQRGGDAHSSLTTATLDNYLSTMMGSMGVQSRTITSSREFAALMVKNVTEQRNSVSAVSLDEEMVNLIKYQQAFSAASKLLTTADEMLSTLLSIR